MAFGIALMGGLVLVLLPALCKEAGCGADRLLVLELIIEVLRLLITDLAAIEVFA